MKNGRTHLLLVLASLLLPLGASAAIIKTNTFLSDPDVSIAFDELGLPINTVVTNQYAGFGVEFSPNLYQSPQDMSVITPNGDANNLSNFPTVVDPVFIEFLNDVAEAAFALATNPGQSTFTTLLNGVVQETLTVRTGLGGDDIYQFTGLFDTIRIDVGGDNSAMLMDNLQYSVPEPTTLSLLGVGLLALVSLRRGRRRA